MTLLKLKLFNSDFNIAKRQVFCYNEQKIKRRIQAMKRKQQPARKQEDKPVTLGDMLNESLMDQLKNKKQELKAEADQKREEEERRKKEERKQREKNKSFEELLGESNMNWREYK